MEKFLKGCPLIFSLIMGAVNRLHLGEKPIWPVASIGLVGVTYILLLVISAPLV
jgi:hypothetical protein